MIIAERQSMKYLKGLKGWSVISFTQPDETDPHSYEFRNAAKKMVGTLGMDRNGRWVLRYAEPTTHTMEVADPDFDLNRGYEQAARYLFLRLSTPNMEEITKPKEKTFLDLFPGDNIRLKVKGVDGYYASPAPDGLVLYVFEVGKRDPILMMYRDGQTLGTYSLTGTEDVDTLHEPVEGDTSGVNMVSVRNVVRFAYLKHQQTKIGLTETIRIIIRNVLTEEAVPFNKNKSKRTIKFTDIGGYSVSYLDDGRNLKSYTIKDEKGKIAALVDTNGMLSYVSPRYFDDSINRFIHKWINIDKSEYGGDIKNAVRYVFLQRQKPLK